MVITQPYLRVLRVLLDAETELQLNSHDLALAAKVSHTNTGKILGRLEVQGWVTVESKVLWHLTSVARNYFRLTDYGRKKAELAVRHVVFDFASSGPVTIGQIRDVLAVTSSDLTICPISD